MLDVNPNQTSRQRLNQMMTEANNGNGDNFKLGIILLSVFIIILLIISGVYLFRSKPTTVLNNNSQESKVTLIDRLTGNTNSPKISTNNQDTDKDGLSDEAELKAGTDLTKPDTDNDGLTDREELMVYKTDPLKADTDGDGISDGQEIKNRTNPLDAKTNSPWPPVPNDLSIKK